MSKISAVGPPTSAFGSTARAWARSCGIAFVAFSVNGSFVERQLDEREQAVLREPDEIGGVDVGAQRGQRVGDLLGVHEDVDRAGLAGRELLLQLVQTLDGLGRVAELLAEVERARSSSCRARPRRAGRRSRGRAPAACPARARRSGARWCFCARACAAEKRPRAESPRAAGSRRRAPSPPCRSPAPGPSSRSRCSPRGRAPASRRRRCRPRRRSPAPLLERRAHRVLVPDLLAVAREQEQAVVRAGAEHQHDQDRRGLAGGLVESPPSRPRRQAPRRPRRRCRPTTTGTSATIGER